MHAENGSHANYHQQTETEKTKHVFTVQHAEKLRGAETVESFDNVRVALIVEPDFAEIHKNSFGVANNP